MNASTSSSWSDQYSQGVQYLYDGELQKAQDTAETVLRGCVEGMADSSEPVSLQSHQLFTDTLLLLANTYSASRSFIDAERLLATCQGYVEESFAAATPQVQAMRNAALAAVAYNRAVMRVDEYLCPMTEEEREKKVHRLRDAQTVFLLDAENRLKNVLGDARQLLADVYHTRGVTHFLLEEYTAAVADFHRCLELRVHFTNDDGSCDLKLALTLEHLSHIYRLLNRHCTQRPILSLFSSPAELPKALEMISSTRARYLQPEHPLVARALFYEGSWAAEQGRVAKAEALLQKSLAASSCHENLSSVLPLEKTIQAWYRFVRPRVE